MGAGALGTGPVDGLRGRRGPGGMVLKLLHLQRLNFVSDIKSMTPVGKWSSKLKYYAVIHLPVVLDGPLGGMHPV